MVEVDTVEALWNQNKGLVQLFVNGALHMELPPAKANELASALGHAAATPILAAGMALQPAQLSERYGSRCLNTIPGTDADCCVRESKPDWVMIP